MAKSEQATGEAISSEAGPAGKKEVCQISAVAYYEPGISWDQLRVSACMKGLLARQWQVFVFQASENGPNLRHEVDIKSGDLKGLHESLLGHELRNHTLERRGKATRVHIYDPEANQDEKVTEFAKEHDGTQRYETGRGEIIGDPDTKSREKGRVEFERRIEAFAGLGRDQSEQVKQFREWYRQRSVDDRRL